MKKLFAAAMLSLLLCLPIRAQNGRYLLRAESGIVCVTDLKSHQVRSTGMPLASLPNTRDRILLEKGLVFSDERSLCAALEDFCS